MARILVLGAGICGLGAAMLLARDGHDVLVLERDAEPAPSSLDEAWTSWGRPGVAQFRQPHYLQMLARHVLDAELPDVRDALVGAGALAFDMLSAMPPTVVDRRPRPGDERFATLTARRPTIEHVFARAAEAQSRLKVRRGVVATGLLTGASAGGGTPHINGVRLASGEELRGDLVVDAMGRRSSLPGWLADVGAQPLHEEAEDSGFTYYTRFFRARSHGRPEPRAALLTPVGSFSILTLPADRDTWSVTLFISSRDQPLKGLRHVDRWTSVAERCPEHAHWLDGEPITDVLPMSGIIDRYRRLAVGGGDAVATGVALVADAWACTNPSLGRGIALGLRHGALLRDVARDNLDDPMAFARTWDAVTESRQTPWYRATVAVDRARLAEIDAQREGRESPPNPGAALLAAMRHDPEVFRAYAEIAGCLTLPTEVFARPGFMAKVLEIAGQHGAPPPAGPGREELLRLLA